MTLRHRNALGMRKARTQGAGVAALRARLRTMHGATQRGPVAEVSFLSSQKSGMKGCAKIGGRRSGRGLKVGEFGS